MAPEPTQEQLTYERAADLSRFESEGGATELGSASVTSRPAGGLEPADADHRGRILILHANQERNTRAIADVLALRLRSHGFAVEMGDPCAGTMPPPQDYDVVILGLPMTFGRDTALIARYVEHNRAGLSEVLSALFTVSASGTVRDQDSQAFRQRFSRSVGWQPGHAAAFAGGAPFPPVQCFADAIAAELANAASLAERSEPHTVGDRS